MKNLPQSNRAASIAAAFLATSFTAIAAQPKTLYWGGGSVDIPDGTPLPTTRAALDGVWNTTAKNWSIDPQGSRYVAWQNGEDKIAILPPFSETGNAMTILLEEDVTLNQIQVTTPYSGDCYYDLSSPVSRTVTLAGNNPILFVDACRVLRFLEEARLVALEGFVKKGSGRLVVNNDSTQVLGRVSLEAYVNNSSVFNLSNTANSSLPGVDEFHIRHNTHFNADWNAGAVSRFKADVALRLANGIFNPRINTSVAPQTMRRIVLENHGRLNLNSGATMVGPLNLSEGIHRGQYGIGTLSVDLPSSSPLLLTVLDGPPSHALLPWACNINTGGPLWLDANRRFEPVPLSPAPADTQLWAPGSRYNIGQPCDGELPSISVEALGIWNNPGNQTLTLADGATLDITSGFFGMGSSGRKIFTGGSITTSSNELYFMCENNAGWQLAIESAVTGAMHVVKAGIARCDFTGPSTNTYAGTTYVNSGMLFLSKPSNTIAIPNDLVIGGGGEVQVHFNSSHQIRSDASITIREDGVLRYNFDTGPVSGGQVFSGVVTLHNGNFQYYRGGPGIFFNGPGFGLVFANGGRVVQLDPNGSSLNLCLLTNVRCEAASSNQATFVQTWTLNPASFGLQRLKLSNAATPGGHVTRVFDVRDAVGLLPEQPELVMNIPLETVNDGPVELVKIGDGDMAFEQFSGWFRGTAVVSNGMLLVNGPYATNITVTCYNIVGTGNIVRGLPSTAGIYVTQPVNKRLSATAGVQNKVNTINSALGEVNLAENPWAPNGAGGNNFTNDLTFLACGSLGVAGATVSGSGTLGGTGGVAGNVLVEEGGTFRPGTPARPFPFAPNFAPFHVGQNLVFQPGAKWRVRVPDGDLEGNECYAAHVAGDIELDGEMVVEFPVGKRPKGVWIIATFEGMASGGMTAPQGCKVRVDNTNKQILLASAEPGSLLMVR